MGVFKLVEPSPSSDPHEQGGPSSNHNVTIALITECYKDYIDSGASVSLARYQKLYISAHRQQFKDSYPVNIDTPQYSRWITYESIRNNYTPTSDNRF